MRVNSHFFIAHIVKLIVKIPLQEKIKDFSFSITSASLSMSLRCSASIANLPKPSCNRKERNILVSGRQSSAITREMFSYVEFKAQETSE